VCLWWRLHWVGGAHIGGAERWKHPWGGAREGGGALDGTGQGSFAEVSDGRVAASVFDAALRVALRRNLEMGCWTRTEGGWRSQ